MKLPNNQNTFIEEFKEKYDNVQFKFDNSKGY